MYGRTIEISVREPSGVPRKGYPLTCGVPFPEGLLKDTDELRLETESGEEVPLQVAPDRLLAGRKREMGLLDFQVDLERTEEKLLTLRFEEGTSRRAEHPRPLLVEERDGSIYVDVGPLSFEVARGGRHPFRDLRIHGTGILRDGVPLHLHIPTEQGLESSVRQAAPYYVVHQGEEEAKYPSPQWHSPMLGSATLTDGKRSITLVLRYSWHNAPKEFRLDPEGIVLYLYPPWERPLKLYRGVAKTHEVMVLVHLGGPEELEVKREAIAFQEPAVATVATRNWTVDFGDHWVPSRGGQWKNKEMDFGYALILQFVRTGYTPIFPWIEQVVMHQIDVDTCHDSENPVEIGSQRYHYADRGWHVPFKEQGWASPVQLCHEWLEGPLFFYFLTGYKRALEVVLARADHFGVQAIDAGYHRQKTIPRVSGYLLMALSVVHAAFPQEQYLRACEKILDWLEEWIAEEGALGYGILMQGWCDTAV